MEPETCPPWWPNMLWWLIHHPHISDPNPPEPYPIERERINEVLVALNSFQFASQLKNSGNQKQMQQLAGESLIHAVRSLVE